MKRESLLLAVFMGISCSISFIAGYIYHQSTMPERKSTMASLSFMNKESEIFKTFDQVAWENFYYNQVSQVGTLEDLEKVKANSKKRLLEEIAKLQKLTESEEKEYKINRNSTMLKVVEEIKSTLN